MKRRSLAQFWCPDLSNQERNPKGKIGSCIAMEAEILEINVSMQKSFRMEILSSDSDSLHRKALDCNIQFRNSFKFWKMVRSTLRIRAQMWKVARPDRGFQNRPKSLMSDIFLLLDFFPVINFHLEEIKRRSLAQFWCPDLSNQERNPKAKIGSCIAMEAEILEINVSMQKSSRMEILSSDSDSLHRKALDCNIQFRNPFKFWKI